ncbi:hypothetical protein WA026_017512 [Henosepilachna vigintioctopunctata]|uniref:Prostaglandin reductase 1 n=1 Tax=Henosepilachna vigintioctopunctata TaxID=420089 RepID=A0AAW1UUR7_9CUCU
MVKAKKFIIKKNFNGFPEETDVQIEEEYLPTLQDGEFLCESLYISVDPYQRCYAQKVGDVALGILIARVIESKNPKYLVGNHVVVDYGWKTYHIHNGAPSMWGIPPIIIDENLDVPLSYFLGVLGHTGLSAYFGLLRICRPKPGETVIVSGAAGAVGSIAGQIAKIKGCKVLGVVGTNEKGLWITKELGFDGYINYKTENVSQALDVLAPEGIDCYFDNVGGTISSQILKHMKVYGRIAVCGSISNYNDTEETKIPAFQITLIFKQLKMEGFLLTQYVEELDEGMNDLARWIKEGKLKSKETITKGFENTFKAFTDMLKGINFGKAVVEL